MPRRKKKSKNPSPTKKRKTESTEYDSILSKAADQAKRWKKQRTDEEVESSTLDSSSIRFSPRFGQDDLQRAIEESKKSCHWIYTEPRRGERRIAMPELNEPYVIQVLEMIRSNHPDIEVFRIKNHNIPPDSPSYVMEAILNALKVNTNCQVLYIHNFNEGMVDENIQLLLEVLQLGRIWGLNLGETYKVTNETWHEFTHSIPDTNVTHMYLSEHTISKEMNNQLKAYMRENRKKHDRHSNFDTNRYVIERVTNMWWNPSRGKKFREAKKQAQLLGKRIIIKDEEEKKTTNQTQHLFSLYSKKAEEADKQEISDLLEEMTCFVCREVGEERITTDLK